MNCIVSVVILTLIYQKIEAFEYIFLFFFRREKSADNKKKISWLAELQLSYFHFVYYEVKSILI